MAKKGRDENGKFVEGNQISVGNNGGAPTDYLPEYSEQAYNYCLLGATDKHLADFFGVHESTINNWKKEYTEFLESIKRGKEQADVEIAQSLFKKAKGFHQKVLKAFKVRNTINGEGSTESIEIAEDELYFPPDTTAIIFWLKNRQPELWRDKQEIEGNINTTNQVDLSKLDAETLRKLKDSQKKA